MATRKPLVIIAGVVQEIPAGDTVSSGTPVDVGILYLISTGETKAIPTNYQYLIANRFIMQADAILRTAGQVVIL